MHLSFVLATTLCLELAIGVSASYLDVCTLLMIHLMAFTQFTLPSFSVRFKEIGFA
jgi:hypothetical protein